MTRAYDEILIDRASDSLGRMLDFAVHSLHYDVVSVLDLFVASGVAADFERGDMRLICGMSGIELAYETLDRSGLTYERITPRHTRSLSSEYWCGYALSLIQWNTGLCFDAVICSANPQSLISEHSRQKIAMLDKLPFDISEGEKIEKLKKNGKDFAESVCNDYLMKVSDQSSSSASGAVLKSIRMKCGLSQSELARASGIPVRTIQQYEQGQKDLSKARAEYLISLSRALHCDPSSLI